VGEVAHHADEGPFGAWGSAGPVGRCVLGCRRAAVSQRLPPSLRSVATEDVVEIRSFGVAGSVGRPGGRSVVPGRSQGFPSSDFCLAVVSVLGLLPRRGFGLGTSARSPGVPFLLRGRRGFRPSARSPEVPSFCAVAEGSVLLPGRRGFRPSARSPRVPSFCPVAEGSVLLPRSPRVPFLLPGRRGFRSTARSPGVRSLLPVWPVSPPRLSSRVWARVPVCSSCPPTAPLGVLMGPRSGFRPMASPDGWPLVSTGRCCLAAG
jgi:hypothetical protein